MSAVKLTIQVKSLNKHADLAFFSDWMNIMRKLLVGGGGQNRLTTNAATAEISDDPQVQAQHTALGLMHLRKLFMELVHTTHTTLQSLTLRENQDKLYKMLPLFYNLRFADDIDIIARTEEELRDLTNSINEAANRYGMEISGQKSKISVTGAKPIVVHPPININGEELEQIFGNSSAKDIMEKFEDIQLFCQMVSRLMVSEIRRLASNKSPEEASFEIVKFLEIDCTEENSNGWMLLTTVNLLASADKALVEVMTEASLPSTLVKCLYLFFDLPDLEDVAADIVVGESEFTPRERRILLQKIFVQVLVRLCSHTPPAEELARADDLSLLFRAITSWCPPHNIPWRKSASEVLMTLSRHGMTEPVVSYIHNTNCVSMCVQNMQRLQELSPLDIVEMFVTVFCFLKDSSLVRQTLLDDFRTCQGYIFISEFLLRLEQDGSQEAVDALRNLLLLVSTLSMCGYIELKPSQASIASLYQISGFQLPQPLGQGISVRNIQAFQVLQSVFLKASSINLCCVILDAISSIYHSDPANYFILESQHTLSQFAEKIYMKTPEIQEKFFEILEFVVFGLNFVPCKELISLSILLKTQSSVKCSILCMETLIKILRYDLTFKDVYREVGLLEVMVTCLYRYAALLKEPQGDNENLGEENIETTLVEEMANIPENSQKLGLLVMEALTFLLSGSPKNCSVFRECGGARCAHNMVPCLTCRSEALGIVQQLVLCNGGDDDMGTLLGMMHTAPMIALDLKTHILKSLLFVLKESHRTRTVFRKVGGFVYVLSILVSMEGCLADPVKPPWDNICFTTLTDTIRLLGCFTKRSTLGPAVPICEPMQQSMFHTLFTASKEVLIQKDDIPRILVSTCLMLRLLYDMALDTYDKPNYSDSHCLDSPRKHTVPECVKSKKSPSKDSNVSSPSNKRSHVAPLNLNPPSPDPVIVHSAVVVTILRLLPGIEHDMALTLQCYTSEMLKSLVRSERNQQVMCEAGLPTELLTCCSLALEDENHPLHPPIQYMFERLAAQTLQPKDLRCFLRLGTPLCCKPITGPIDDVSTSEIMITQPTSQLKQGGGAVPLTRVKTLVSMTTPRDFRLHGTAITPPFVEFDMSAEGFGCLYLPSIAPQSISSGPTVVGAGLVGGSETSVVGGIGTGDRIFPPQTGLTFSTWFCVDRFSDPRSDPHAVRLLMLIRNAQGREQEHLVCFTVLLSSRDKALIVSTQEYPLPQSGGTSDWEPEIQQDLCIRIWSPDLIQEGQWHHLVLILNRAVLKNSSYSLFLDSQHISTKKLHYITQNPGGGAANLTVASSVYAYIGTPPSSRRHSRLVWKQGVCLLVEEILSTHTIAALYTLGPNYLGSLQAPVLFGNENSGCIAEEKVVFGLNAMATSQLTLAKIRKVYSKVDSKSIAKLLGMSSHDNAAPIRIMHNSAGHLNGPARSVGGVLIGYLGVRTFCPRPVACMLETVGGTASLLGLIAMASDVEGLYAAVKALVCVVRSNWSAQVEMDRTKGYQTLAMLLKKKKSFLNSHILHLTFSLVGTIDSGRESSFIPNTTAFSDLLCDIEVWRDAPFDLQRSLYEHFVELVTESAEQKANLKVIRDQGMVLKLLNILQDPQLSTQTSQVICNLLTALLQNTSISSDILCFGQFTASTLPTFYVNEKRLKLEENIDNRASINLDMGNSTSDIALAWNIILRNKCLKIMKSLLYTSTRSINHQFCEDIIHVLGFDWFLLFIHGHLHQKTVIATLHILVILLTNQNLLSKFREATQNGGWLYETEPVLKNRMGVVLGFNVGTTNNKTLGSLEIVKEAFGIPGFQVLQWLAPKHFEIPQVYFLLLALLLQQPVKTLPDDLQFDLDSIWLYIFGVPASQSASAIANKREICPDVILVLLAMVRYMLNQPASNVDNASFCVKEYPVTLIQFLLFLYHNTKDFMPLCMTSDTLCSLASTLFPYKVSSQINSEIASPVEEIKAFPDSDPMTLVEMVCQPTCGILTEHPARKFVVDFLRVIVVDSLSMPIVARSSPVIDILLESVPVNSTRSQQSEFQTELLTSLMEHLLAADVLLGEQAALPIADGGSYANIGTNVFYFASRVVDKLWQGEYTKDSNEVFDFIIKLIGQAKRKHQMSVMEALHKLTTYRNVIFGPDNNQSEFLGCLCYCLLQLTDNQIISMDTNRKTLWHTSMSSTAIGQDFSDGMTQDLKREDQMASYQEGQGLIIAAARRVWEELYHSKRMTIEDIFKASLMGSTAGCSVQLQRMLTPDLQTVRDQIYETSSKIWLNFVESETDRKSAIRQEPWQLHNQLQSKLQKVTGGLTRLATRKPKRENTVKVPPTTTHFSEMQIWTFSHLSIIKDLVEFHFKQYQQSYQHIQKYVFEEWLQTESELTRECGLWGPISGSLLDKWMLDMTEGPSRMRKKMINNELFYIHYPYRPDIELGENKALKYKVATSYDSKDYYQQYRGECLVERDKDSLIRYDANLEISNEELIGLQHQTSLNNDADLSLTAIEEREIGFQGLRAAGLLTKTTVNKSTDIDDDTEITADTNLDSEQGTSNQEPHDKPDNQTVLRLLEAGEKISYMFRCARIQGLDTCEGLLLFGKEHFYVVDGFTLLKTREIRDIDYLPAGMHEPIVPSCTTYTSKGKKRMCSKFPYEDIREVHIRRYLLQPVALEVFSADGRNYLLAFPRNLIGNVHKRFMMLATAITDSAHQSVSGQKRNANVEPGAGLLSSLIGDTSVTQRWVRGEISNFQYLMHLNTLAGRSYNDLMQYPIFPWVVADYESEELDLCCPSTFRDFTMPMGAQSSERLKQFMKRYKEWDDPHGETPPYHYGTHYSSAMIVASYLVRMEPFTQHFLGLQGGHFDLADRMFHSIRDAWLSASKHNMADVKELIPEFFYLPEFLINSNNFDLGFKQSGIELGDIILPAWAKGDPREFIRAHRQALECDYVSSHLHEWIDLIFGYKQQGPPAIEAVNVFHHLFYEGKVDIYNIDDPLKKNATIGFINNFGQIPKQLFKKPHPQKKLIGRYALESIPMQTGLSIAPDKLFFHNLDNLKPSMQPVKELRSEVGQIICMDKSLLAVEQNKCLIPPHFSKYVAWGFADHSLRIGNYESDKATFVCESLQSGEVLCCTCPNSKLVITGGTSTVVNVWQLSSNRKQLTLRQSLYGHTDPVTCVAASPAHNLIVSGSRDRKCIIWDMSRLCFVRQLIGHEGPVAAIAINELTGDIATCAGTYLHIWTINGGKVASVNTAIGKNDRTQQILCVAFSQLNEWDPQNVVLTGSSDGIVRMWSTDYVQVPIENPLEVRNNLKLTGINQDSCSLPANNAEKSNSSSPMTPEHKAQEMIRRLSVAEGVPEKNNGRTITRSESESSLSDEDADSENKAKKSNLSGSKTQVLISIKSVDESKSGPMNMEDTNNSLTTSNQNLDLNAEGVQLRNKNKNSSSNILHRCSTVLPGRDSLLPGDTGSLRMSRSDTSIADSFVLVSSSDVSEVDQQGMLRKQLSITKRTHNQLREGFKWQCQLVFRSKLTMHTAFNRKDNCDPAAITALAISKDHKTVYVGESKGHIFSWSVTDHPGRVIADHWIRDEVVESCLGCGVKFTFAERRHHCRNCGQVFCSRCSKFESEISRLKLLKPVRVCKKCFLMLKMVPESL
ncbi:WD repeat and FYVE domain-containing protein 3 [Nymphon striatum]|nr:WD repeat and FYVE domain-containing protein 3 [Nymphon striatum]